MDSEQQNSELSQEKKSPSTFKIGERRRDTVGICIYVSLGIFLLLQVYLVFMFGI